MEPPPSLLLLLFLSPHLLQCLAIRPGHVAHGHWDVLRGHKAAQLADTWQGERLLDGSGSLSSGAEYERGGADSSSAEGHADVISSNARCQNTMQGRVLVSDDRGYTCHRWELNFKTGCCSNAERNLSSAHRHAIGSKSLLVYPRERSEEPIPGQYSCATCDLSSSCCSTYEYCVSCCLDPERTDPQSATAVRRAQQASASTFASVFEFCATRCRHNSKSVVHENAYVSELHHCFSLPHDATSPSSADSGLSLSRELARDVSVLVSNQGVSCDDACFKANLQCAPKYLSLLNSCTVMRQHLACQGGCQVSAGPDQPAEVVSTAPARQRPGACVVNSNPSLFSCSGFHENTRRLCPCRAGVVLQ